MEKPLKYELCLEYDVPIELFPRFSQLRMSMKPEFSKLAEKIHPFGKEIKSDIENLLTGVQTLPKLFVFTEEKTYAENTDEKIRKILNTEHQPLIPTIHKDEIAYDKAIRNALDNKIPSAFVVIVNSMDSKPRQGLSPVIPLTRDSYTRQIEKEIIFVIDKDVSSRKEYRDFVRQLQVDGLTDRSKQCRIFHVKDAMARAKLSRIYENDLTVKVETIVNLPKFLEENISHPSNRFESIRDFIKMTGRQLLTSTGNLPHTSSIQKEPLRPPGNDAKYYIFHYAQPLILQMASESWSRLYIPTIDKSRHDNFFLWHYGEYVSCFIQGLIFGACHNPLSKNFLFQVGGNLVNVTTPEQLQHDVAKEMSRVIVHLSEDLSCNIDVFIQDSLHELHSFITSLKDSTQSLKAAASKQRQKHQYSLDFDTQICLSRIPGIKTIRVLSAEIQIYSSRLDSDITSEIKNAVGEQEKREVNIKLFPQSSKLELDIQHGNKVIREHDKDFGTLTMFVKDTRNEQLYCLTCEHVAPIEHNIYLTADCVCNQLSSNCICQADEQLLGICKYSHSLKEESPYGGNVDISAIAVNETIRNICATGIRGLPHASAIVQGFDGNIEEAVGKEVFKWGATTLCKTGRYVGKEILLPSEEDENFEQVLDIRIPRWRCPGVFELIESEEEFGKHGDSGSLICFAEHDENRAIIARPGLVYVGRWRHRLPGDNKYLCFSLKEGLDCLRLKSAVNFEMCFDNIPQDRQISRNS